MKIKCSCIKVFYCFNVTVNAISHFVFTFFYKTIYYTAEMINHAGILLLTQNILHYLNKNIILQLKDQVDILFYSVLL